MPTSGSAAVVPWDQVLRDRYRDSAARFALRDHRRTLTYGELGEGARRLANGLRDSGVRPGDRVMLIGGNSCEWIQADHACYAGSFVRVAVLPRLHPRELAHIACDAEPTAVVADADWLRSTETDWIPPSVTVRVAIGGEAPLGWEPFDALVARSADRELKPGDSDAVRWILYTSGTTGLPKGVVFTNRTLGAMVRNLLAEMPSLDDRSVALHSAPVSHFSGGIAMAVFAAGGRNLLMPSFDTGELLTLVAADRPSILPLVPTQITMLLLALERAEATGTHYDASSLRMVLYSGSAIAPDRLAAAQAQFGRVMMQLYGSSEAPFPVTALHPDEHVDRIAPASTLPRLASAGRPNRFVEVRVVSEAGEDVPPGEVGEVLVRGSQVTPGYWRNPEATAETLSPDGWCRTGDAAYFDAEGYLYLVDRKKDMIITGGFNVYPREVENVVSAMPGVAEVAVLGLPDDRWGERVTAFVACAEGSSLTADDVVRECRGQLADFKVPKEVRFVPELPKSGAGKVLKRVLREQLWAGQARRL